MSDNHPLAVIILAAGRGKRMKSDLPKVMHTLAGKPILSILIDQVEQLSPDRIIVVAAPDMPDVQKAAGKYRTAIQDVQRGTADAVKAALPELEDFNGNVMILLGDEPFVPMNVLQEMAGCDHPTAMAIIPPSVDGLGRMILSEEGMLDAIVEDKDCTEDQREIYVCNAGNYCLPARHLKNWINDIGSNNAQSEYYLTDIISVAKNHGLPFEVFTIPIDHVWGINDRLQLSEHEGVYQDMLRDAFAREGVSMIDPSSVYFHHDTKVAAGVLIEPNVFFGPKVSVEKDVHIKAFSHLEGAKIRKGASIGPFARIRPGSEIGADARIGNFVEIKKSDIGAGAKIGHLAYVGDCQMGADTNFSAGAITVNYDGFQKHETIIGKNVMVGSNVNLVAPVSIDDGAFIAAGSTVTQDVPADSLSIARGEESVREGWAAQFRRKKKSDTDKKTG